MKGIVSSGSIFHSNYTAKYLLENNMLGAYIVGNTRNKRIDIDNKYLYNIRFQNYIGYILRNIPIVGKQIKYNYFTDNIFDFLSTYKKGDYDFFIGFNNYSLYQMKKYKKNNIKLFLDQRIAHVNTELEVSNSYFGYIPQNLGRGIINKKLKEYDIADYILVGSEYVKDSFIKNGVKEEKLIYIPYGYNPKEFFIENKNKKFNNEYLRLVFVGQIGKRKGVNFLLKAIKNLIDSGIKIKMIFAGNIDQSFKKEFEKYNMYYEYKGFLNIEELRKLYNESDLFVFPSLCEGSARVIYDAAACGLPIITTYSSGSIIESNIDGIIIKEGDSKEIEKSIKYLYKNRDIINKFSRNLEHKIKNYTWDKYGERLSKEIYKRTIVEGNNNV